MFTQVQYEFIQQQSSFILVHEGKCLRTFTYIGKLTVNSLKCQSPPAISIFYVVLYYYDPPVKSSGFILKPQSTILNCLACFNYLWRSSTKDNAELQMVQQFPELLSLTGFGRTVKSRTWLWGNYTVYDLFRNTMN